MADIISKQASNEQVFLPVRVWRKIKQCIAEKANGDHMRSGYEGEPKFCRAKPRFSSDLRTFSVQRQMG